MRLPRAAVFAVVCVFATSLPVAHGAPRKLPTATPESVGMRSTDLAKIDAEVEQEITAKRLPGAVILIGRQGSIVFQRAYGNRQVEPDVIPMTIDTVFDLASLTKPVATATSVMLLVEAGKLRISDRVAMHIPEFAQNGKEQITLEQLLTHQSGLIADNAISDYADGPELALERVLALRPVSPPGTKFIYSDMNFVVLGELVRRTAGENLQAFTRYRIFEPLGMTETGYLPEPSLRARAAPTEQRDGRWMRGEVHDPRAHRLGGIAGHAGLFSTASDLAVYAQMVLERGSYGGVRIARPRTIEQMTRAVSVPGGGLRGLGWDVQTAFSINKGKTMSPAAFGHGGFTGTGIWIDPELELFVIFLSNRVHPNGKGLVNPLIGRIGTIAASAIENPPEFAVRPSDRKAPALAPADRALESSAVLTGIDVLERDKFSVLAGRRVGLITNQTGINRLGKSTVDLLANAPGVTLVALFSPEHGLEGKLDVAKIADGRDEKLNLPVYSLYGQNRQPTQESLAGIDTLVFDIQDIGTRFYTYPSTMGNALRSAAEHKLRFVVLDRPNPINGIDVAGPVLDAGKESFVGYHRLPVRHGMTVGELARIFNEELKIGADLTVIAMEGWRRGDFFDATGLLWVNPSPNMRNLNQALLYPGIGLLEMTNLSVGRGTDTPFEIIGAPWLDGRKLAEALNRAPLGGVRFVPTNFTPAGSKFKDERCGGAQMIIADRSALQPVRLGFEIARQLALLFPREWDSRLYDRLLSSAAVFQAVTSGKTIAEIEALYQSDLEEFLKRREQFLIYR
jgi:uncharacterized protein YbbC (DUF1343 family)/CubicO group peptidase (beta-lactamase class C family)